MSPFFISKSRTLRSKQKSKERTWSKKTVVPWSITALLLGALFWFSSLALSYFGGEYNYSLIGVGQRAPRTVISEVNFKRVDVTQTEQNRKNAVEAVPPVFLVEYESMVIANRSLNKLFRCLAQSRHEGGPAPIPANKNEAGRSLSYSLDLLNITVDAQQLLKLVPDGKEEEMLEQIKSALRDVYVGGIASPTEKDTWFNGVAINGRINIYDPEGKSSTVVNVDQILTPDQALAKVVGQVQEQAKISKQSSVAVLSNLLRSAIEPNLVYDKAMTEHMRLDTAKGVAEVTINVAAGTTLVEAHERVTPDIYEALWAYEKRLRELETPQDRLLICFGNGILLLIALAMCSGLLRIIRPELLEMNGKIFLMFIISVLTILPAKALIAYTNNVHWITAGMLPWLLPLGLAPLLATILMGGAAGLAVGFWTSFNSALLMGHSFKILTIGLLMTMVAVYVAREVHRRSRIFRAGLNLGLAGGLCAVALSVLDQQSWGVISSQIAVALLNGMLCAFLVLLLLPLFEALFRITTDISLLELSDMGNPLLQRLALEAPGTYHHSLMVANLAAGAAREIGANELLVRVGAYFHDIGKLTKPEFFIENAQFRNNPHDELAPSMSTLVVISHVKEGMTLAMQYKLPKIIIDAIRQHHGTSLVSFFLHRARQQSAADAAEGASRDVHEIKEEDFRYPGPKPKTREMAILFLADSVEAASRSMEKMSVRRIDNMVNDIIDGKMADGQLDECELTLAQLNRLKRSFVFSLTNMLHGRIPYPENETGNKQPPADASASSQEHQDSDEPTNAPG